MFYDRKITQLFKLKSMRLYSVSKRLFIRKKHTQQNSFRHVDIAIFFLYIIQTNSWKADVAQLVEHLTCNERVGGSTPFIGSMITQAITATYRYYVMWLFCFKYFRCYADAIPKEKL